MLWNGVSSTPRLSAQRCMKASSSSSTAAAAAAPSRGGGQNQYSARAPSRCTCQGSPWRVDHAGDPVGPALGERDRHREVLVAQGDRQGPADRGEGQRVAGERAADAGHVDVVTEHRAAPAGPPRRRSRRTPRPGRHRRSACRPRRCPARGPTRGSRHPGPAQSVWVSSMTSSVPASPGQPAHRVEVAGLGQHDPDVGEGRLHQQRRPRRRGRAPPRARRGR